MELEADALGSDLELRVDVLEPQLLLACRGLIDVLGQMRLVGYKPL